MKQTVRLARISTLPTTPRWGGTAIDMAARKLPGLKLSFPLRHAARSGKLPALNSGQGKILLPRPSFTVSGNAPGAVTFRTPGSTVRRSRRLATACRVVVTRP